MSKFRWGTIRRALLVLSFALLVGAIVWTTTQAVPVAVWIASGLFLPGGEKAVRVAATISVAGKHYTGEGIWRVGAQAQNGFGLETRTWVVGEAIAFELPHSTYAFLLPDADSAVSCAASEHPELEYRAAAVSKFVGPCEVGQLVTPLCGTFLIARVGPGGLTALTAFAVGKGGIFALGGRPITPAIQAVSNQQFALLSLKFAATSETPSSGTLAKRFPWILELPSDERCRKDAPPVGCASAYISARDMFEVAPPTSE